MFEKWITLDLGQDIECTVRVSCVPSTPLDELERRAREKIRIQMGDRQDGLHSLGDELRKIVINERNQITK